MEILNFIIINVMVFGRLFSLCLPAIGSISGFVYLNTRIMLFSIEPIKHHRKRMEERPKKKWKREKKKKKKKENTLALVRIEFFWNGNHNETKRAIC